MIIINDFGHSQPVVLSYRLEDLREELDYLLLMMILRLI